jgi:hypothetical protein
MDCRYHMRGMIAMEMGFRFPFFTTLWHNQNNIHEEFFRIPELFVLGTDPSPLAQHDKSSQHEIVPYVNGEI